MEILNEKSICLECKKEYKSVRKTAKYCSNKCKLACRRRKVSVSFSVSSEPVSVSKVSVSDSVSFLMEGAKKDGVLINLPISKPVKAPKVKQSKPFNTELCQKHKYSFKGTCGCG